MIVIILTAYVGKKAELAGQLSSSIQPKYQNNTPANSTEQGQAQCSSSQQSQIDHSFSRSVESRNLSPQNAIGEGHLEVHQRKIQ
jgi:hypothetical protein